jgi:hypothetical protein
MIPKRLKIAGLVYKVELADSGLLGDSLGACDYIIQNMRVLEVLPKRNMRKVLWHEIAEAIAAYDLLEMEHETMTVAFNRALEVLDNNPALRAYLWGGK